MCLNVYLGCYKPLHARSISEGSLGFEKAKWSPPALAKLPFRYYMGNKGSSSDLECSCPLAQHVEWTENGPSVSFDSQYPRGHVCPFEVLRGYVNEAQQSGKPVVLVCDDSGGCPQECDDDDYEQLIISSEMITPDNFLFADPRALFPWRVFHLIAPAMQ
jgi:hypothetical protein